MCRGFEFSNRFTSETCHFEGFASVFFFSSALSKGKIRKGMVYGATPGPCLMGGLAGTCNHGLKQCVLGVHVTSFGSRSGRKGKSTWTLSAYAEGAPAFSKWSAQRQIVSWGRWRWSILRRNVMNWWNM